MREEFLNKLREFEGVVPHLYLDGVGIVTVGIGTVIPNVGQMIIMPFAHKSNDTSATSFEKEDEFRIVKKLEYPKPLSFYEKATFLKLHPQYIESLFQFKVKDKNDQLKYALPEAFENEAAHEVCLDMAYNLGVSGLVSKFPKFCDAIRRKDYRTAGLESFRYQVQASRNAWAEETLLGI